MQKPILNIYLFSGGALDGLFLSVEQGQKLVTCIEVKEKGEVQHIYELRTNFFAYKS